MKGVPKHSSSILPVMSSNIIHKILGGIIISIAATLSSSAQPTTDTAIKVDVLRAPSSPASVLLGLSPSDIEKPSDVTGFMASLRNATENFSVLPENYAVEIAPFKLLNKTRALDAKSLLENKNNFHRSFVFSFGVRKHDANDSVPDSKPKTQIGTGIKFALVRGQIDDQSRAAFERIYSLQRSLNLFYADVQKLVVYMDSEYQAIQVKIEAIRNIPGITGDEFLAKTETLFNQLEARNQLIKNNLAVFTKSAQDAFLPKAIDSVKKVIAQEVKKIRLERKGFNLDFSAGTVIDFMENKIDKSSMFKTGAWLTGGWNNTDKSSSALFILRYLYNPETALANPELNMEELHTFDGGGRLIITALEKKLLLSGELIYRSILNDAVAESDT